MNTNSLSTIISISIMKLANLKWVFVCDCFCRSIHCDADPYDGRRPALCFPLSRVLHSFWWVNPQKTLTICYQRHKWCFRPRYCAERLYSAGDKLGQWDEFWFELYPRCRFDHLICWPAVHCYITVLRLWSVINLCELFQTISDYSCLWCLWL